MGKKLFFLGASRPFDGVQRLTQDDQMRILAYFAFMDVMGDLQAVFNMGYLPPEWQPHTTVGENGVFILTIPAGFEFEVK